MNYKIVTAKCSECGFEMKLSFEISSNERYTYCAKCDKATIWKEVIL